MHRIFSSMCVLFVFLLIHGTPGIDTDDIPTTIISELSSSTVVPLTTSTKKPSNTSCGIHNNDCKGCVSNSSCYFCDSTKECHHNFGKGIVDGQCEAGRAFYGTCKASVKVLAIIFGVLGGIVLLIVTCVCCYCCCKKKGIKVSKDDIKWARQREERKQIADERRKERTERTEEIRKKYGLKDSNPYQRFDA